MDQSPPGARPTLAVAYCTGQRCAALHDRRCHHGPDEHPPSVACLHASVRTRPEAVLIATDCLGACHRGSLAVVGPAAVQAGSVRWLRPPVAVELMDDPDRAGALADWITAGAPDPATLPPMLRT
ncbi:hypothetical protein [Nakamurella leprariae]|uniref:(2Fe-2S) ferredoxin domain-containing protein n=1 Tax=Nakamurella leprariae TaxID=2803911 RepID=A0A938YEP6_9ACTN|nr:hypothetical protein [Nakamurella leprariae]MBM9469337.1 hypothetical protein [Nakamurella leprariae]